ncbi:MAG: tRNA (adenosine(37)-N6)-threonylcarbamoyltransferase complex dimerization subunit type 1 TsaB [Anaerolineales bacterium]|jgi:tRNA threonylcarbamoyladenosine biosynthesis protein TsaB|nr:tRNA (adenosine(37)-N6)-threonylcarbamoyltransferase complex dimerization subunit type 1 TsaB [Anaerolineales bacterium]MBK9779930.1 tRNA (adenosine(37)-N6)-threonylcarbamoyltransferase complex dimerization subunit type 1 TsaB [Anaerolineales bacterium]
MLLAVDTSTSLVGLALYDGDQVLGEMTWTTKQHHTTELSPALSGLLKRCGVSMSMVTALGVAIGPGSFTSLRVGLSLIKGIALARNLPVMGISTLDVIAAAQPQANDPLVAVLQAGRTRIAFGVYKNIEKQWQPEGAVRSGTLDELLAELTGPTIIAGELTVDERKKISKVKNLQLASPILCVRRPAVLAELAWNRWQDSDADDAATLAPIYLHVAGTPIS